jgi:hypothetical protein
LAAMKSILTDFQAQLATYLADHVVKWIINLHFDGVIVKINM